MPPSLASHVVADGLVFPECPRWHDGALWFSDLHGGNVYRLVPGRRAEVVVEIPGGPSGLGWTPGGDLLVVSMFDQRLLRYHDNELTVVADFAGYHPGPSNDMIVDAVGRAYVGNIGFDYFGGADPAPTDLVRVDPDGSIHVVAREVVVPNGMALSPDGTELILAESFGHCLTRFDVDPDGELQGREVFADLGGRIPDGIALDPSGDVWFGSIGAHEVVRVARGGRVVGAISTGELDGIACVVGGTAGQTLYICAAGSPHPEQARQERSGAILAVELTD